MLTDLGYETNVYIKTHNKTGLRYFGKTTRTDVEAYRGSGTRWKWHINKHGYDCKTVVVLSSRYKEELEAFCSTFSTEMDIVKSKDWANLIPENGVDGTLPGESHPSFGSVHSAEVKAKIAASNTGKTLSEETKAKISAYNAGKIVSEKTRAKMSASGMGRLHSEETRAKMSATARSKENHHLSCNQWEHPSAKPYLHLWAILDEVYDWWVSVGGNSEGQSKTGTGYSAAAKHFGYPCTTTWQSMHRLIRTNGDPRLNEDWIKFKEDN